MRFYLLMAKKAIQITGSLNVQTDNNHIFAKFLTVFLVC